MAYTKEVHIEVVKEVYKAYREVNGIEYFRVGIVAEILGKSRQIVQLWDSWSDELETEGKPRLIPKSTRIGANKIRCWTKDEIDAITVFSKNIKYGELASFSRTRWGERSENLSQDRSIEGTKARIELRKNINRVAKLKQKQQKVQNIKLARGNMLKAVRSKAKSIYNNINYDKVK